MNHPTAPGEIHTIPGWMFKAHGMKTTSADAPRFSLTRKGTFDLRSAHLTTEIRGDE